MRENTDSNVFTEAAILGPIDESAWFLAGPTACGKSDLAMALAEELGAEILSMDSMALYRGMDIGTAKPSPGQRQQVPHHLVDILDPTEEFSIAQYIALARETAAKVRGRGREVLFVGGTPLYLKALLRGMFTGPPPDWEYRQELQKLASLHGDLFLHNRLRAVDPASADRLHVGDARRIIRALEVFEKLGQPLSSLQRQFEQGRPAEQRRVFVLDRTREELRQRIDRRVESMFCQGLVDETRRLLQRYGALSRTASQGLGYKEVLEHLRGLRDLSSTVDLVKARTRAFAKRQRTWYRSLTECRTLTVAEPTDWRVLAEAIHAAGQKEALQQRP